MRPKGQPGVSISIISAIKTPKYSPVHHHCCRVKYDDLTHSQWVAGVTGMAAEEPGY